MTKAPVERARLAWLGARCRFEKVVDKDGSDEEYYNAREEMQKSKRAYDQMVAAEGRR